MDLETAQKINKHLIEQASFYHRYVLSRIALEFGKHPMKDVKRKAKAVIDDIELKREQDLQELESYILKLKKEFENGKQSKAD